jgi:hypothetical protein
LQVREKKTVEVATAYCKRGNYFQTVLERVVSEVRSWFCNG